MNPNIPSNESVNEKSLLTRVGAGVLSCFAPNREFSPTTERLAGLVALGLGATVVAEVSYVLMSMQNGS